MLDCAGAGGKYGACGVPAVKPCHPVSVATLLIHRRRLGTVQGRWVRPSQPRSVRFGRTIMVRTRAASLWVARASVAWFWLIPSLSFAQSTGGIAGVVKDTSGGVIPGVSVEAASPALIERVRTVVTDTEGQYKVVDLRPGIYTVTFSLQGFKTVRRDGIELTSSFTATVNAEMGVGTLEETVTVSGQASTVDVQNVVQQRVLSRNVMDDVPVGTKTLVALGVLIPGVVPAAQDVGGTGGTSSAQISIH